MHVSLFAPRGDFEDISAAVTCAEDVGFDGALFGEHHGTRQNHFPQLLPLLAALAARTTRIKLGTSILLLPLHDPVHVAETAAMIDRISNGRLILGVGIGYQPIDFQQFGIPFSHRVSRFEEALEVIRRAWTEDELTFTGKRFHYSGVRVFPRPVQEPHPPIWLAAWTEAGARRAGRSGDAYVTDPIQNLDATAHFVDIYRGVAERRQRTPRVVLMREFLCAPSRSEAEDRYAEGLLATYRYYWRNGAFNAELEPWVNDITSPDQITFDQVATDRVIVGTPDDCVQQIETWARRTGAEHIQLAIPGRAGAPQVEAIRYAGEHVVQRIHDIASS